MAIGAVGAETQNTPAQESAKSSPTETKDNSPAPAAEDPAAEINTNDEVSLSSESGEEETSNAPSLSSISENFGAESRPEGPQLREDGTEIQPGDPDYDPKMDPLEGDGRLDPSLKDNLSNCYWGPPEDHPPFKIDPSDRGVAAVGPFKDDKTGKGSDRLRAGGHVDPDTIAFDAKTTVPFDGDGRPPVYDGNQLLTESDPTGPDLSAAGTPLTELDPTGPALDAAGTPLTEPDPTGPALDAAGTPLTEPDPTGPDLGAGGKPTGGLSGSVTPDLGAAGKPTGGISGTAAPDLGASGKPVSKSGNYIDIEDARLKNGQGSGHVGGISGSITADNAEMGSFKNDDKNLSLGKTGVDNLQVGGATVSASWGGFQYDKEKGLFGGGLKVEAPKFTKAEIDLKKTGEGAAKNVVGAVRTVGDVATGKGITASIDGKAEEASVAKVDGRWGDDQVKMTNASVKNAELSVAGATDLKGNAAVQGNASAQNIKVDRLDATVAGNEVAVKGVDVNNASVSGTGVALANPEGGPPQFSGNGTAKFEGKVDEAHLKGNGREAHVNNLEGSGSATYQNGTVQAQGSGKVGEAFYKDGTQEYHVANGEVGARLGKDGAVEVATQATNFSAATGGNRIDAYQVETGARITQSPEGRTVQMAPSYLGGATFQDAQGNSLSLEGARMNGAEVHQGKTGIDWRSDQISLARASGQDKDGKAISASDLALQSASGHLKPVYEDGINVGASTRPSLKGYQSSFQAQGFEVGTLTAGSGESSVRVESGKVAAIKLDEAGKLDLQGIQVGSLEAANGGVRARLQDGSIQHLTRDAEGKVDLDKLQVGSLNANGMTARGLDIEKISHDQGLTTVSNTNLAGLSAGGAQVNGLHLDQATYQGQVAEFSGLKIQDASMGPARLRDISLEHGRYSPERFQAQGLGVGSASVGPASLQSVKLRSLDMSTQAGGDFSADGLNVGRVGVGPFGTSVGAGHIGRKSGKIEASGINLAGMDLPWLRI
ncbi:MAG: hypothetical protein U0931_29285 [Vulcanimicrobiota bacterium]